MSDEKAGPVPGEDALDRALRELTEGSAGDARFREPSAAERAAAARKLSRQAARQAKATEKAARTGTRKRTKAVAKLADNPADGWRGGYRYDVPAAGARRRRAGRRVVQSVAWIASIAILGCLLWFAQSKGVFGRSAASGGNDTQLVTNGAIPPVSLGTADAAVGPPADPFAGTPADSWANGAAGIVTPTAAAHVPYSKSQVAQAFAMTRKLLMAANLDPATLAGGAPSAFAGLLLPAERSTFIADLNKMGTNKQGYTLSTRDLVTSFAPGTTTLIGKDIKVHGTMTASAVTGTGGRAELHVNVDYRFAYAVEPPGKPADWRRVVVIVGGYVTFGDWQSASTSFAPWTELNNSIAGARCDVRDGYVHPAYPGGPADTTPKKGVVDPYSTQSPSAATSSCFATNGT
jgi:hypothetical protein